ncbi:MAG: TlpA family protein disulfide reductase [bacterium]
MTRLFSLLFFLITVVHALGQSKNDISYAKLKGKLLNFAEKVDLQDFSAIERIIPSSRNNIIQLASDSSFSVKIPLSKPGYYRLGRNILYLSPGDDLDVVIDHSDSKKASIKGKGASANLFLRSNLFPKGGSFVDAGRLVLSTPIKTLDSINALVSRKRNEISNLKGVSKEFIRLENARLKADVLNTFKAFSSYAAYALRNKTEGERAEYLDQFKQLASPITDSLLKGFVDPTLLQLEVYRDIYGLLNLDNPALNPKSVMLMKDWRRGLLLSGQLKRLTDKTKIMATRPSIDSVYTPEIREAITAVFKEKMKFGDGDLAINFKAVNEKGDKVGLSDLKGKVIYLDLWATWCGPCMAEMPNLELLKKKYENENQLAIVSLSIDDNDKIWLDNLQKRQPKGIQWRTIRENLPEYGIASIPRYIIIDKNFKISNLNAEKPSSSQTVKVLDALINGLK